MKAHHIRRGGNVDEWTMQDDMRAIKEQGRNSCVCSAISSSLLFVDNRRLCSSHMGVSFLRFPSHARHAHVRRSPKLCLLSSTTSIA